MTWAAAAVLIDASLTRSAPSICTNAECYAPCLLSSASNMMDMMHFHSATDLNDNKLSAVLLQSSILSLISAQAPQPMLILSLQYPRADK